MRPAVIYAAKSTADTRGSIPTQFDDCQALADREGLDVVDRQKDETQSAYRSSRGDGLARAKEHSAALAVEHGECALIVQHTDRLARGDAIQAAHLIEVWLWALKANVKLRSVQDDHNLDDMLRAVLIGERNHEDSRRKALAVSGGMKRVAERGRALGIKALGYGIDPDKNQDGRIIVVEHEAEIVRRVFREFIAGQSFTAIARNLVRDGVPTRKGGVWRQSTVAGVVKNRVYIGEVTCKGETFAGSHDPIIDTETFERAQQLLEARPSKGRGRPPAALHLFRQGMLRCGKCGEAMAPRTSADTGLGWYYCNGRGKLGKEFCDTPHIPRADVDSRVFSYFERVGLDVDATRAQVANARDSRLSEVRSLIESATRAERKASEALARVKRAFYDGEIDATDWKEAKADLEPELTASTAELERLREQERAIHEWADVRDAEAETLRKLAAIRSAIAGEVNDAEGVDAVRAALAQALRALHRAHRWRPGPH
jgi:DNA invertase Pin-like site-specific DNA recombinase